MTTVPIKNPRASVPAVFVDDFGEADTVNAGHWHFYQRYGEPDGSPPAGILFGCPCGCGSMWGVSIRPGEAGPTWNWDGNREQPTLTPSILIYQMNERAEKIGEHWHGFLTAGEFRSC